VLAHGKRYHPEFIEQLTPDQFRLLVDASRERSKTLDELYRVNHWLLLADEEVTWPVIKPVRKAMFKGEPTGLELLERVSSLIESIEPFESQALEAGLGEWAAEHCEGNLGRIAQPLRIAVTGGPVSPPIFDTLVMLGRERTLKRIARCRESLAATQDA
jgi:glutamyl-tRNA synthetase